MQFTRMVKKNPCLLSGIGLMLALSSVPSYAGTMGEPMPCCSPKVYASVFGGGGGSTRADINQFATAFFLEEAGGPLAVDAFGKSNSPSAGLVGGHLGYQWSEGPAFFGSWNIVPAAEIEGFYLGKSKFNGHEINNTTDRLDEHDFLVTLPTKSAVFLINSVLNFNMGHRYQPYLGAGIGAALLSISGATSIQTAPFEPFNHFNARTNDRTATFAGQVKAGVNFSVNPNWGVFAEYRGIYIAKSQFTFGSTKYPGLHAPTSSWQTQLGSHFYNTGVVGLRYTV